MAGLTAMPRGKADVNVGRKERQERSRGPQRNGAHTWRVTQQPEETVLTCTAYKSHKFKLISLNK